METGDFKFRIDSMAMKFFWMILCMLISIVQSEQSKACVFYHSEGKLALKDYRRTFQHQFLDLPMQYYGWGVISWDLALGQPPKDFEKKCKAWVIAKPQSFKPWFSGTAAVNWLNRLNFVARKGMKLIILETPGIEVNDLYANAEINKAWRNLLSTLDLKPQGTISLAIPPQLIDRQECRGEVASRKPPRRWLNWTLGQGWRERCIWKYGSQTHGSIVYSSKGFIAEPEALFETYEALTGMEIENRRSWRVDPFPILAEVLDVTTQPTWDVNLKLGQRVFFSHVDADGMNNLSQNGEIVTQIVKKKVLDNFSGLPVTLSVIGNDLVDKVAEKRVLEMWNYPQVDFASHTATHPFVYSVEQQKTYADRYEKVGVEIGNSIDKINWEREVIGNARRLEVFGADVAKKVSTILWSGNCMPLPLQLKLAEDNGITNINGGDSRYDAAHPSIAYLSGIGVDVGGFFQVYTGGSNETIYTNGWKWQFHGFGRLQETWHRTDDWRLLKPVNLYYHFYLLEKQVGLNSLVGLLTKVQNSPIFPYKLNDYLNDVKNWRIGTVIQSGKNQWSIKSYAPNATLRFEKSDMVPDLIRSENVIGYRKYRNQLYVYLGDQGNAFLKMKTEDKSDFRLHASSGWLKNVKTTSDNKRIWSGTIWAWNRTEIAWKGVKKPVVARWNSEGVEGSIKLYPDDSLHIRLSLPNIKQKNVNVELVSP